MSACLFANLSFFICLNVVCVFEIAVSDIKTTGLLDDCGHIRDRGMLSSYIKRRNLPALLPADLCVLIILKIRYLLL